jgi:predicted HAD superfamily Cof-like phosphohydrolase
MVNSNSKITDPQLLLREWHEKFGVFRSNHPQIPDRKTIELRIELIREEFEEFRIASEQFDLVGVADAIADLLYVVYGAAEAWGIPASKCFQEVHRSNMTKVWSDGTVHKREDGKVIKPPTYSPADLKSIVEAVPV